jgi:hypothetical protein
LAESKFELWRHEKHKQSVPIILDIQCRQTLRRTDEHYRHNDALRAVVEQLQYCMVRILVVS